MKNEEKNNSAWVDDLIVELHICIQATIRIYSKIYVMGMQSNMQINWPMVGNEN